MSLLKPEYIVLGCLVALSSCDDYEAGWSQEDIELQNFVKSGVFDFKTSHQVALQLDYSSLGNNCPVSIYSEYPYEKDATIKSGVYPEFAFILNEGKYADTCSLPSAVDKVYMLFGDLYSPADVITATVTNGALVPDDKPFQLANAAEDASIYYYQQGLYTFEVFYNDTTSDFDMNDVAVEYSRQFIVKDQQIEVVNENYTLINDGESYRDGFAIQLPYDPNSIQSITCIRNGERSVELPLNENQSTTADINNGVRIERGSKDNKVTLVLFDNIKTMAMHTTFYFWITFKQSLRPKVTYSRDSYNPFVIVYNAGTSSGKRTELHLPGHSATQYGKSIQKGNSQQKVHYRWYVCSDYGDLMPFGLDIPDPDFVSTLEQIDFNRAYPGFRRWIESMGESCQDWYKSDVQTKYIGWERQQ